MTNFVLYRANERGYAQYSWLTTFHSFSFGRYVDREKVNFGALRVLNEDFIAPDQGFGEHPHDNMEIITLPLVGALAHQDSMGHRSVITQGDIQVMSAGTGLFHSEFNPSATEPVHLLQIWIIPNQRDVQARYQQASFDPQVNNLFQLLVSPQGGGGKVWIHQEAWLSVGQFDNGQSIDYKLHNEQSGAYVFIISGEVVIESICLTEKDALGITDKSLVTIDVKAENTKVLLIEIPMVN